MAKGKEGIVFNPGLSVIGVGLWLQGLPTLEKSDLTKLLDLTWESLPGPWDGTLRLVSIMLVWSASPFLP